MEHSHSDAREHDETEKTENPKILSTGHDAEEDVFSVEHIEIEEIAIDGICGVY